MPDAFFQRKRKRTTSGASGSSRGGSKGQAGGRAGAPRRGRAAPDSDASDRSDGDDDFAAGGIDDLDLEHRHDEDIGSEDEAYAAETPAEARVRLAKMYLEGLKSGADEEGADAAVADRENIALRLQKDVLEHSGKLHVLVASRLAPPPEDGSTLLGVRGHRLSVTCALASADGSDLYTAGKEGHIIRWNMKDGKMLRILPRRQRETTKRAKEGISSTSGAARRRENAKAKGKGRAQDDGEDSTGATIGGMVSLGKNEGHTDEVWTLALSSDGRYLASGGKDRQIGVWSIPPPPTLDAGVGGGERWLKGLGGHKDSISALSFRLGSAELYSASFDRTLKLFDVTQLSYIETLFGHQDPVLSLSALRGETAVSAGGRDRTVRFWKIRDESQLVFRGGGKSKLREVLEGGELADETEGGKKGKTKEGKFFEGSLDCVTMIDEQNFLSGGDSGSISLWSVTKKKPVFTRAVAHGLQEHESETEGTISTPRWITSLACLPYGDVFASGSWDGSVRLWALDPKLRSFRALFNIPAPGFVNSLQLLTPDSKRKDGAVDPDKWRRRGGLGGMGALASSTSREEEGEGEDDDAAQSGEVAGKETAPTARGRKEAIPPILIVGLGQEPKMGRWMRIKEARNGALVVPLSFVS